MRTYEAPRPTAESPERGLDPHSDFPVDLDPGERRIQRLRLLWDARRVLARTAAGGFVLGCLLAVLTPAEYKATTQLMPPDNQGTSTMVLGALTAGGGDTLGALASSLLGMKNSGALFVGVVRSRTVQDRLVQRFDLKHVYGESIEDRARKKLAGRTQVSEDRKSGIITITVTDRQPQRAAAIAQAYTEELDRVVAQLSTSSARRERVFLEERLKAVKVDLDQAAKDFSQFASKNATIDLKEQGRAMVEGAATVQGQLIAAESELKGLEQIYTANNVRVRSVQARIAELRRQLDKLGGRDVGEASAGGESAGSLYPSIRQLPLLGVTYTDLLRRAKIQEVVFETLTKQYELAKVQEAKEIPTVKVLDSAEVPEKKSFPPRAVIVALATLLALATGVVWVLGSFRWQEIDAQDPGKVFAREVLQTAGAHMPWAAPNGSRLQAMSHKLWIRLARRPRSKQTD